MRRNLVRTLLAMLTVLVAGAGTAGASTGWTVTPGGSFTGTGGPTPPPVTCTSTVITGSFFSSLDGHIGEITEVVFNGCTFEGFLPMEIDVHTPVPIFALSYAAPVVDVELRGFSADFRGPGCLYRVDGFIQGTYDNDTAQLALDRPRLTVTFVDPLENCFGLVNVGDAHDSPLSPVYDISPPQRIEPF